MKILHVGNIASVGYNLSKSLRKKGVDVDLISKRKSISSTVDTGNWIHYTKNKFDEFRLCGLDIQKYDLIHDHYLLNWGSLGLRFRNFKKPVILHAHGTDTRPSNLFLRLVQRFIATQSSLLLYSTPDLYEKLSWFKGERKFLPNPVEIPSKLHKVKKYKDRILLFGRLDKEKKWEKVFSLIEGSDLKFDVIGSGPDLKYYRDLAPSNINFIKPIKHKKIISLLLKYPLIIGQQGGSIGVCELEAMSLGILTLFPFEYDKFYKTPLVMPKITKKNIKKYFGDYGLGQKQRMWVNKYHNVKVVSEELVKIYKEYLRKTQNE